MADLGVVVYGIDGKDVVKNKVEKIGFWFSRGSKVRRLPVVR